MCDGHHSQTRVRKYIVRINKSFRGRAPSFVTQSRVPEGQASLAQRDSAGKGVKREKSRRDETHVTLVFQQSNSFSLQHEGQEEMYLTGVPDQALALHGRDCTESCIRGNQGWWG